MLPRNADGDLDVAAGQKQWGFFNSLMMHYSSYLLPAITGSVNAVLWYAVHPPSPWLPVLPVPKRWCPATCSG